MEKREIKFRLWMKKEWSKDFIMRYWDEINDCMSFNDPTYIGLAFFNKEKGVDEGTVIMQYTGIKDLEGNEIYEGDILKNNMDSIGLVIWFSSGNSGCYWQVQDEFDRKRNKTGNLQMLGLVGDDWCDFEIKKIGNIYENPELL